MSARKTSPADTIRKTSPIDLRRQVQVNCRQLRTVAAECFQALVATNKPPSLFARGTQLVRIVRTAEGVPIVRIVNEAALRNGLSAVIDFHTLRAKGVTVACVPPLDVVRAILAYAEWADMPPLLGLTEAPTLRPDGSILQEPGYDTATRLV